MAIIILPGLLRDRVGKEELRVGGATVGAALHALEEAEPSLRGWILDEQGSLRQHVSLFLGERSVALGEPLDEGETLYVVQAISGGASASAKEGKETELLVGTKKGLIVLAGRRGGPLAIQGRHFPGQSVDFATRDPRSGRTFAAVTHGQFGPHLYWTDDLEGKWQEAEGMSFPADTDATLERIWIVEPGEEEGLLWAGVAPAALFVSRDGGRSWSLNRSLWNQPSRPRWEGGLGGLCLHSICPWPGEPGRLAVGISAAGVWLTEDGGRSWRRGGRGLVPRYLPEEAREDALMLCVHNMRRLPLVPETLFMQFHGGVYRSDDGGELWRDIGAGLPADFGFPIEIDPRHPGRAFVIPLASDEDRVTPEGRLRVFETGDGGNSWHSRSQGLPERDAYLTILRQAFCRDGGEGPGLYFGATSGELFGSIDGGDHWSSLADHLPPVLSVRSAH